MTGLAVPTVSRALSGATDIGEKTRQRVRSVAAEIGYVPNRAGVRLRTGRSYVISLVLPTESDVMNVTARLINSSASALRGSRYHLTITPVFPDEDPMKAVRTIVETRTADGVILNQLAPEDPRVRYLMDQNFPFATHGRTKWSAQHDYFDFDNYAYARLAVQRLAAKGRRNIALLAPPREQFYALEMIRGAQEAAELAGVAMRVMDGVTSDTPTDLIEKAVAEAQTSHDRPDGIITASSAACMAAVIGIENAGLTLGRDLDLYSKEAIPFLERFRPQILTQFEDAWAAGSFLAEAVLKRIEDPQAPLRQKLDVPREG